MAAREVLDMFMGHYPAGSSAKSPNGCIQGSRKTRAYKRALPLASDALARLIQIINDYPGNDGKGSVI